MTSRPNIKTVAVGYRLQSSWTEVIFLCSARNSIRVYLSACLLSQQQINFEQRRQPRISTDKLVGIRLHVI